MAAAVYIIRRWAKERAREQGGRPKWAHISGSRATTIHSSIGNHTIRRSINSNINSSTCRICHSCRRHLISLGRRGSKAGRGLRRQILCTAEATSVSCTEGAIITRARLRARIFDTRAFCVLTGGRLVLHASTTGSHRINYGLRACLRTIVLTFEHHMQGRVGGEKKQERTRTRQVGVAK